MHVLTALREYGLLINLLWPHSVIINFKYCVVGTSLNGCDHLIGCVCVWGGGGGSQ